MRNLAARFGFCLALIGILMAEPAVARKVALVMGNSAYGGTGQLDDAANDAVAISQSLRGIGFDVHEGTELTVDDMRSAIRAFSRDLDKADIALFYFAGHAVQVDGKNYLLPVDFDFEASSKLFSDGQRVNIAAMLEFDTLRLDVILEQMQASAKANILFLDACRDNPFATALATGGTKTRSIGNSGSGLAPIETNAGALIGFSTSPGKVSYEGLGDNSPFAEALLKHIKTPGLEINSLMTRVRADVFRATGELQRPWTNTSLIQEVYLTDKVPDPTGTTVSTENTDIAAIASSQTRGAAPSKIDGPTIKDGTVEEIVEVLTAMGGEIERDTDDEGDLMIWFERDNGASLIQFYDCFNDQKNCWSMEISVSYEFDGGLPSEQILRWNRKSRMAEAYNDEDLLFLEYDVNLTGRLTVAWVTDLFERWETHVLEFEDFIDW